MTNNQNTAAADRAENDNPGKLAGTGAGVIAGAQLGTVLLPIPIVGTFSGALVGGLIGNKIGKRFGRAILDKMDICSERPSAGSKANLANELQRLTDLHDAGVLTDDEFSSKGEIAGAIKVSRKSSVFRPQHAALRAVAVAACTNGNTTGLAVTLVVHSSDG